MYRTGRMRVIIKKVRDGPGGVWRVENGEGEGWTGVGWRTRRSFLHSSLLYYGKSTSNCGVSTLGALGGGGAFEGAMLLRTALEIVVITLPLPLKLPLAYQFGLGPRLNLLLVTLKPGYLNSLKLSIPSFLLLPFPITPHPTSSTSTTTITTTVNPSSRPTAVSRSLTTTYATRGPFMDSLLLALGRTATAPKTLVSFSETTV